VLSRRAFLSAAGATALGLTALERRLAGAAAQVATTGPYGPLQPPDANGLMLPRGFSSRVVARAGTPVPGTGYVFPLFPDGAATFPLPDGGWSLCINSEVPGGQGGVSALRFDRDGRITGAGRVLGGTSTNCAGGPTPWGTWLSCEEVDQGLVWECDPTGRQPAVARPALGTFKHEAACVDPEGQSVYLTEDLPDGCLYRFRPATWPMLEDGVLEACVAAPDGRVTWAPVPDPSAGSVPTRAQVPGATRFRRGEGLWYDDGVVYVATTGDAVIHALDVRTGRLGRVFEGARVEGAPLQGVDNITVSPSGDLFVCEDTADPDMLDVCLITPDGQVARFAKVTGAEHRGTGSGDTRSELTGVAFDPSGERMYFGSQRAAGTGVVFEVTGPFRTGRPARAAIGPAVALEATRRARIRTVLRRGLGVGLRLTLAEPAEVTATLRARATVRGRRRTVVLARERRRFGGGPQALRLEVRSAAVRALLRGRRRSLRAELEVRVAGVVERREVVLVAR
jgi:uncharacterized protein